MRAAVLLLSLLALGGRLAGARDSMMSDMAPAPGPAAAMRPKAELTFFLSADRANFTAEDTVALSGVAYTVPYVADAKHVKVLPTARFANSSAGSPLLSSDGSWLDKPQAVLYGANPSGNLTGVGPLTITQVAVDTQARTITFTFDTATALKLEDGPVNSAVSDSQQGVGPKLQAKPMVGEAWKGGVQLAIQTTRTALHTPADTKFFGWGWGHGWGGGWGGWGCGWGCGGWGWGWGK